jgi:hypothetical protein
VAGTSVLAPLRQRSGAEPTTPGMRHALAAHVVIRLIGLAALYVGGLFDGSSAYHALTRWDAVWYGRIAEHGYGYSHLASDGRQLSDQAFFPLFPLAERAVSAVTGLPVVQSGLAISAVSSVVAAAGIYRVGTELHDARTGLILVCLWSSLPVSIVQSMAYTESMFTALVAWSLYGLLTHQYVVAGALATLAGLTRPMSMAIVAAVVCAGIARTGQQAASARTGIRGPLLGALLAPIGLVAYVAYVARTEGRTFGYFDVANRWGNNMDGGKAKTAWVLDTLNGSHFMVAVGVLLGLALLGAAVAHTAAPEYQWPIFVFTVTAVLISLSMSDYGGSTPRYLLPVFTLLLWPSGRLGRLPDARVVLVLSCLAAASSIYGAVWLYGPGPP